MSSPAARPPWPVIIRRFWRRTFRSQTPGFKVIAALSAVVLAAGVGTALVGFGDNGTSTLHQGPSANGPGANGVGPSAGASTGSGQHGGAGGTNGTGQGGSQGPGGNGGAGGGGPT